MKNYSSYSLSYEFAMDRMYSNLNFTNEQKGEAVGGMVGVTGGLLLGSKLGLKLGGKLANKIISNKRLKKSSEEHLDTLNPRQRLLMNELESLNNELHSAKDKVHIRLIKDKFISSEKELLNSFNSEQRVKFAEAIKYSKRKFMKMAGIMLLTGFVGTVGGMVGGAYLGHKTGGLIGRHFDELSHAKDIKSLLNR